MTNLQTLANIGEIIGAITVVLSLIYLAIQIRQNTQTQRSENYTRALDRLAAMQSSMAQDEAFANMFSRGVANTEHLSPQDRVRFT
jgi:heme/copper-type cytochrome/quinol oxidase subunit 1